MQFDLIYVLFLSSNKIFCSENVVISGWLSSVVFSILNFWRTDSIAASTVCSTITHTLWNRKFCKQVKTTNTSVLSAHSLIHTEHKAESSYCACRAADIKFVYVLTLILYMCTARYRMLWYLWINYEELLSVCIGSIFSYINQTTDRPSEWRHATITWTKPIKKVVINYVLLCAMLYSKSSSLMCVAKHIIRMCFTMYKSCSARY